MCNIKLIREVKYWLEACEMDGFNPLEDFDLQDFKEWATMGDHEEMIKLLNSDDDTLKSLEECALIINLPGKAWMDVSKDKQEYLLRYANPVNGIDGSNVIEGDCIVDFEGFEFISIVGKVTDGEIIIDDNAKFYNPSL